MIVKFKNPHPGIGGPVEALPENAKVWADHASGETMQLHYILGAVAHGLPPGFWVSVDHDESCIRILQREDDDGFEHVWKLIEFDEVQP